jgi:putative FmdB family regulatory protein
MPIYQFSCPKCGAVEETFLRMSEIASANVRCACKTKMLHDMTPHEGFVQNRTVGSLAETNDDKMSLDHKLSIVKRQYKHGQTINERGDKGCVPSDVLRNLGVKSAD